MNKDIQVVQRIVREQYNEEGEMIDVAESNISICTDQTDFALVYANIWNILEDHNLGKVDIVLLGYLIQHYADGRVFTINGGLKKELAERSKLSVTSFNNSTRKLLDRGLIYSIEGRSYKVNPRYAFKGSSKDRNKAIVTMSNYCKNC